MTAPSTERRARRRAARDEADDFAGVLPRWRLLDLGYDHAAVQREIEAERWRSLGTHTVAVHTGTVDARAHWHRAVWETAADVALLDGTTALIAAGMTGWSDDAIHVSVPRNARCPEVEGVQVHRVRRTAGEVAPGILRRSRVEVAALRAAAWVRSDRQAALVLCLVVQQRLSTGPRLQLAFRQVRNRGRRPFVRQVLRDLTDGAQSLGELDFATLCRRYGLPQPERQVIRHTPAGRIYLDARWAGSRLVVEIDGAGHRLGLAVSDDNLRQNAVTLGGDLVLRIDLVGLRVHERAFMEQVAGGLRLPRAA